MVHQRSFTPNTLNDASSNANLKLESNVEENKQQLQKSVDVQQKPREFDNSKSAKPADYASIKKSKIMPGDTMLQRTNAPTNRKSALKRL
jgi:hypothetical protein